MIRNAIAVGLGLSTASGDGMTLSLSSSDRYLYLLVMPIPLSRADFGARRAVAAVLVQDPRRTAELPRDVVCRVYNLTPAEARVATALADGKSLKEYAEEAAVTIGTARWLMKQVQAKTDTRRQAELVRLLLTGPAGLSR